MGCWSTRILFDQHPDNNQFEMELTDPGSFVRCSLRHEDLNLSFRPSDQELGMVEVVFEHLDGWPSAHHIDV